MFWIRKVCVDLWGTNPMSLPLSLTLAVAREQLA